MSKYYSLAVQNRIADLYIFGDITSFPWAENDVSSFSLVSELATVEADEIRVHINSYGGEVAEGLAIYNTLVAHPAKVTTICEGFACSAASFIFMAGDERIMQDASMLMIHNAYMLAHGTAEQLRKEADDLEKINARTVEIYLAADLSVDEAELTAMLDAETWLTPTEALEIGFATSVIGVKTSARASQSARRAAFDLITIGIADTGAIQSFVHAKVEEKNTQALPENPELDAKPRNLFEALRSRKD